MPHIFSVVRRRAHHALIHFIVMPLACDNPGVSGLIVFRYLSREVLVTLSAVSAVLLVIIMCCS
jgi:hypothetical protein